MKLVIAFALLGLSAQMGDLQARESANYFDPWHSGNGHNQNTVPSQNDSLQRVSYRQSYSNDRRHPSLQRADKKVYLLERERDNTVRVLKRAQKRHASSFQLRKIKRNLHRVNERLHHAKREYQYLLKSYSGKRRHQQHLQLSSVHKAFKKPYRSKLRYGHRRPKYSKYH